MLSNVYVAKILEAIREECYLSIHFDDPELAGNYASEVSGGGYHRIKSFWTEPASRSIWLAEPLAFTGLLQTRMWGIGGWDKEVNGDPWFFGRFPSPYNVLSGGGLQLVTGDVVVSVV